MHWWWELCWLREREPQGRTRSPSRTGSSPTANTYASCVDTNGGYVPNVSSYCKADNSTQTVYIAGLGPRMKQWTQQTLDFSWGTLDLTIVYHSTPVLSGSAETDTVYAILENDPTFELGTLGRAWCEDKDGITTRCDQHYVEYNGTLLAGRSDIELWQIACHETGHTFGLTHGSDASPSVSDQHADFRCMKTEPVNDHLVGPENSAVINANY